MKQFQEILLEEGIENALRNSKFEKCVSKSAKRCTFEILNPKPQNVLKSHFKMLNSKNELQKVAKSALLKS